MRESARKQVDKLRVNPVVRRELERIASSLHTIEEAIQRISEDETDETAESQSTSGETLDSEMSLNGDATPGGVIESSEVGIEKSFPGGGENAQAATDSAESKTEKPAGNGVADGTKSGPA